MAAMLPAAIGVGSSLIGGISGKGAAKKQQRLAEQQFRQIQPLLNAQIAASQFGLDQARQLYGPAAKQLQDVYGTSMDSYNKLLSNAMSQSGNLMNMSTPYLQGAGTALSDLQKFYRPFMTEGASAIERFLPSAQQVGQLLDRKSTRLNSSHLGI